jgi:hypothetical protein
VNEQGVPVTDSLFAALRQIRWRQKNRIVWIDQLCINQTDDDEKAHQIALMGTIYSQTIKDLLWLGEIDHADFIPQIGLSGKLPLRWVDRESGDSIENSGIMDEKSALFFQFVFSISIGDHFDQILGGRDPVLFYQEVACSSRDFYSRHWWTRIWTAQECVLPLQATILYGPFTFEWPLLLQVSITIENHAASCCKSYISHLGLPSQAALREVQQLCLKLAEIGVLRDSRLLSSPRGSSDLVGILHQFLPRDASDPRDRIYGLLRLLEARYLNAINPDYSKSVEHVYEDAT